MSDLQSNLAVLVRKTIENNLWRQRRCVNLIPSENTPSLLVKLCEISDPSGRYAEHKTALKKEVEALQGSGALKGNQVYYYQGTEFIYEVEERLRKEFSTFIHASDVESRPVSGQMANEIVFKAVVKFLAKAEGPFRPLAASGRMATVMNNSLNCGGHLSAQPFGALFNFVEGEPVNFPLSKDNPYKIDSAAMLELVDKHRPPLVIFGKSMFLHPEPVKELKAWLDKTPDYRPVVMYDGAHVLGILGPFFQDPLVEGADVVTGSTHKTFFGPQRGIVAMGFGADSPLKRLGAEIHARAFPGSTSNHHLGTQLAMLAATLEMNAFKAEYQKQVLANARAFANACANQGIPVEGGEADGYTETHQVVLRVKPFGDGKEIASRLEASNIITNYQALPDDETFYHPSGIRTGVAEMTRFGMKEADFETLARLTADIIVRDKNAGEEVAAFRSQFLTMGYCLPAEETLALAPALFESLFAGHPAFAGFAAALKRL
jgi:glycine/serine hydroxymethyltransferase